MAGVERVREWPTIDAISILAATRYSILMLSRVMILVHIVFDTASNIQKHPIAVT